MPSWSASQKWKVISSICSHTLATTLLWEGHWSLYKRISFISRPAPAYLSHPDWNEGQVGEEASTASAPQAADSLPTASRSSLFRNSWSFWSAFCPSRKLDWWTLQHPCFGCGFGCFQTWLCFILSATKCKMFSKKVLNILLLLKLFEGNKTCFNTCRCVL